MNYGVYSFENREFEGEVKGKRGEQSNDSKWVVTENEWLIYHFLIDLYYFSNIVMATYEPFSQESLQNFMPSNFSW